MSLVDRFASFRRRSVTEKLLFLEAYILLGVSRGLIRAIPFQRIVRIVGLHEGGLSSSGAQARSELISAVSWAVQTAARFTPWESVCLGQALCCSVMLKRRGIPGELSLGVGKIGAEGDGMSAHAWTSAGGVTVTGGARLERYSVIATYCW